MSNDAQFRLPPRQRKGTPCVPGCDTAVAVGFSEIQAKRAASQSVGRLLIQTGRPLEQLTIGDLEALADACRAREAATGQRWRHYRTALVCAHTVLFHLDIVSQPPEPPQHPAADPQITAAYTKFLTGTGRTQIMLSTCVVRV